MAVLEKIESPDKLERRHRRSIRLRGYDYSGAGAYFVTACTWNREPLFGEIVDGEMHLNAWGGIVAQELTRSIEIRREILLDEWVIMPNHLHVIVVITGSRRGDRPVAPTKRRTSRPNGPRPCSVASFMAGFKSAATKRINIHRNDPGVPVWQRNYFERIIRDDAEMHRIREYIGSNPAGWAEDENHPDCLMRMPAKTGRKRPGSPINRRCQEGE